MTGRWNLEQNLEAFLFKVIIVRENFADAEIFHSQYRNATGQTVSFVQTLLIKIKCFEKNFRRMRKTFNIKIN